MGPLLRAHRRQGLMDRLQPTLLGDFSRPAQTKLEGSDGAGDGFSGCRTMQLYLSLSGVRCWRSDEGVKAIPQRKRCLFCPRRQRYKRGTGNSQDGPSSEFFSSSVCTYKYTYPNIHITQAITSPFFVRHQYLSNSPLVHLQSNHCSSFPSHPTSHLRRTTILASHHHVCYSQLLPSRFSSN